MANSQKIKKPICQKVQMIKSQYARKSNAKGKNAFKSKAQKVNGKKVVPSKGQKDKKLNG